MCSPLTPPHSYLSRIFKKTALACLCLSTLPGSVQARTWTFDTTALGQDVDVSVFEQGGQLPGVYPVDILINGVRQDSRSMDFRSIKDSDGNNRLRTCLTSDQLRQYGVKVEDWPGLFKGVQYKTAFPEDECATMSAIPYASEQFDFNRMELQLSVPQIALWPVVRGIAPEGRWDDGIPAFLLNYRTSIREMQYRNSGAASTSGSAQLEPGLNLGAWRFRNLLSWQKNSGQNGKWERAYSRVERGLNDFKSRLTLGEYYTPSDVFDSVPFRGVMVGTDESMVPFSQRAFAPQVKGIARTRANIEVRQNGYLIYSTTVAPGEFELTDLAITGSGGDLEVTVLESDGNNQVFIVPWTTPAIAVREGYLKYNASVGEYHSSNSAVEQVPVGQLTAIYGLPWGITVFGGGQFSDHYQALSFGLGLSAGNYGAVSLNSIHARGQKQSQESTQGALWGLRYSKTLDATNTGISFSHYQYTSPDYTTLSDVLNTWRKDGYSGYYSSGDSIKNRTSMTLSQSLGSIGSFSLSGTRNTYRYGKADQDYISASFGSSWKGVSWSLSMTEQTTSRNGSGNRKEQQYGLWVNIPLSTFDMWASTQAQGGSGRDTSYMAGLNGRAFDRQLNWNLRQNITQGNSSAQSSSVDMDWSGAYGNIGGGYNYSKNSRQMNAQISGGLIAHRNGVTLGQTLGTTTALVEAPGASGVAVNNWTGVKTDFRGYTTLGYLSPYQDNTVTLDPVSLPEDAEITQTDTRVTPTKGAVVPATFQTRIGGRALITLSQPGSNPVPFGAIVSLEGNGSPRATGVVGNESEVYMSGLPDNGTLLVQWGDGKQCRANYQLPKEKGLAGVYISQSQCN